MKTPLFIGLLRGVSAVFSTPAECVRTPAAMASGLRRRGAESYQKGARVSGLAGVRWVLPAVPAFAMVCALVVRALSMVDGRQV